MRVPMFILAFAGVLALLSAVAAAGGSYSVSSVTVQTRDGSQWADGAPIVLIVQATSTTDLAFPDRALSVVMQTDGERTKCLEVAMKRVSLENGTATYAGVFYPFRAATYDGKFSIGDDVTDIRFTVTSALAPSAPITDGDLPVLGPVRFDYGPDPRAVASGAGGLIASFVAAGLLLRRRRLALG